MRRSMAPMGGTSGRTHGPCGTEGPCRGRVPVVQSTVLWMIRRGGRFGLELGRVSQTQDAARPIQFTS